MTGRKRTFIKSILDIINPYAWVTGLRNMAFDAGVLASYRPEIPAVCIGNLSVGGTGKTPHTEYLVRLLKDKFRIAVLSRGYGRSSKGYIKADAQTAMAQIGDEPFQIKDKFPEIEVAVCEKRADGIRMLLAEVPGLQAILLDDAYQHRYVKAGLNILLIDSNRPVWLDCILPFGRLRESLAGIGRADIVIMTKCSSMDSSTMEWCRRYIKERCGAPVFFSRMKYGNIYPLFNREREIPEIKEGCEVLLVTGIAKPAPLRKEIESRGAKTVLLKFADHHNFTNSDIEKIAERYESLKGRNRMILTTEKDATRLLQRDDLPQSVKENIYAMPIEVEFLDNEEEKFNQIIENHVTENPRNS